MEEIYYEITSFLASSVGELGFTAFIWGFIGGALGTILVGTGWGSYCIYRSKRQAQVVLVELEDY